MQGSGVTPPVRVLANETPLLVISDQSLGEKSIDNTIALVLRSHKFSCVFFIFTGNIWLFRAFVICEKQVCCGSTCLRLMDPQHFDNVIHDIISSSIRGQTIKDLVNLLNWAYMCMLPHNRISILYNDWSYDNLDLQL